MVAVVLLTSLSEVKLRCDTESASPSEDYISHADECIQSNQNKRRVHGIMVGFVEGVHSSFRAWLSNLLILA